ncbi:hypothetical protein EBU91_03330 [bacterium]|nr:hypothetical protein [bacterium]
MNVNFYNDIMFRIKDLSLVLDNNSVIIEEYFRRLYRDSKNTLNGEIKTNFIKKIKEMEFGLVEPKKTFLEFFKENKKNITRTSFDLIKDNIIKITKKKIELTQDISHQINSLMIRMNNFFKQNNDKIMKYNLAKKFYFVVNNKMKKSIDFNKMTEIMKWSIDKMDELKKN